MSSTSGDLAGSHKGPVASSGFSFAEGSKYDLQQALQQGLGENAEEAQAAPGEAAVSNTSARGGGQRTGSKESKEVKNTEECRACPEPKAKGSAYCTKHKRGFQCIYNRCCAKNKDGTYKDPQNAERFHNIFGTGREAAPNQTLANKVVIDWVVENPEGKEGKKRGNVCLAKYVDRSFARLSTSRLDDDMLWDQEIFVNKFRALRGWSQGYAQTKFKELESDPNVYKDSNGMGGSVRVAVPPSWTGEERQRRGREIGQERQLEKSSKKALSDADSKKVEEEIAGGGFRLMDVSALQSSCQSWVAPLPASAITNLEDSSESRTALKLVEAAAMDAAAGQSSSPQRAAEKDEKPSTPTKAEDNEKDKQEGSSQKDLDLKRLKLSRTADSSAKDALKKLEEAVRKGYQTVLSSDVEDEDLQLLLRERAQICMHVLGSAPAPTPTEEAASGEQLCALKMIEYDVEDASGKSSTWSHMSQ